jgi:hypothetical protein
MFVSLVEVLVKDGDSLEVDPRVGFASNPTQVLPNRDKHCYIVIARLAALHGNSKRDILSPSGVFSSGQHFSPELAWHCYCQDRVGGL